MELLSLEKAQESTCKAYVDKFKVCKDASFILKGDLIEIKISRPIIAEALKRLTEKGFPPVFCPYANVIVAVLEDITGSSYDIKSIERVSEHEILIILEKSPKFPHLPSYLLRWLAEPDATMASSWRVSR